MLSDELKRHLSEENLKLVEDGTILCGMQKAMQSHINHFIQHLSLPNGQARPVVEVCFIASEDLGAQVVALVPPNHYAILLKDGTLFLLLDAFLRVMAHSKCFTDIGNPECEVVSEPTVRALFANVSRLTREGIDGPHRFAQPKCPIRREYAELLVNLAFRSLVSHELGHIFQGHLLLDNFHELSKLDCRTLEDAADFYAVHKMAQHAYFAAHSNQGCKFLQSEESVLLATLRAMLFLHYFEEACFFPTRTPVDSRSHPLPRARQVTVGWSLQVSWSTIKKDGCACPVDSAQVFFGCECAIRAVTSNRDDLDCIDNQHGVDSEGSLLLQNWQEQIRPRLEHLAFTELFTAGPSDDAVYGDLIVRARKARQRNSVRKT